MAEVADGPGGVALGLLLLLVLSVAALVATFVAVLVWLARRARGRDEVDESGRPER